MSSKILTPALLGVTWLAGTLFAAGTQLSAGTYRFILSPRVDKNGVDKIEKQLNQIQEIKTVSVKVEDSSLHFTVKESSHADLMRITNAVKLAVPGTVVSEPMAEPVAGTLGVRGTSAMKPIATGGY